MTAAPRTWGTYKDLFVPAGDARRGKTHCDKCGGRTRDRISTPDRKKRARHARCR